MARSASGSEPLELTGFTDLADLLLSWQVLLAVVAAGGWYLLLRAVLVATRPAGMPSAPPSQDLGGDEPPAVVSMLANRWRVTVDAVESTMLDLAARRFVELRQLGDDPRQTTIHLVPDGPPRGELAVYERQVLNRVEKLARGGVLPISALTFRDPGDAKTWADAFEEQVRDDARRRGLSRPRISPTVKRLLALAAALPAGALALAAGTLATDGGGVGAMAGVGFVSWAVLSGVAARYRGERDTPAGREAARRWAGLRRRLQTDDAFQALPPAGVAVWDRYLPYGTALGVSHVCSAVLDLGMGDREQVWSSFGGTWHRVRVRYPRFWRRYGAEAFPLILNSLFTGGLAVFLIYRSPRVVGFVSDQLTGRLGERPPQEGTVRTVLLTLAFLVVARACYRILRTTADLVAPRTTTGELLWVELWKTKPGKGEDAPPEPDIYYAAVDDGRGDRTTAWALPVALHGTAHPGDTVTVTVRPWSRRVLSMARVPATESGPAPAAPGGTAAAD